MAYAGVSQRGLTQEYRHGVVLEMPDDNLGWAELLTPLISGLIQVGGQFATAKISTAAITKQIQMQTQAQIATAQAQAAQAQAQAQQSRPGIAGAAEGILSSPYILPVGAAVGLGVLFLLLRRRK